MLTLTHDGQVKKEAHLGLGVDLALVAAGVGGAQALDVQRVAAGGAAGRARGGGHARVRSEHGARVRQDLKVAGPNPRYLNTNKIKYTYDK